MKLSVTVKWIGLALLGLVIAAGVAIAASHFASQQIGIASESVSAGEDLAPVVGSAAGGADAETETTTTDTTSEITPTVPSDTSTTENTDSNSGSDDHRGSESSSDDRSGSESGSDDSGSGSDD